MFKLYCFILMKYSQTSRIRRDNQHFSRKFNTDSCRTLQIYRNFSEKSFGVPFQRIVEQTLQQREPNKKKNSDRTIPLPRSQIPPRIHELDAGAPAAAPPPPDSLEARRRAASSDPAPAPSSDPAPPAPRLRLNTPVNNFE